MFFKSIVILMLAVFVLADEVDDTVYEKQKEIYLLKGQLKAIESEKYAEETLKSKEGFFIGAILGNSFFRNSSYTTNEGYPIIVGIKGGYQKFLNQTQAGFRAYLDYLVGFNFIDSKYIYQNVTANFDAIGDVMFGRDKRYGISFFGGYGMGLVNVGFLDKARSSNYSDLGIFINLGVGVVLNLKHRIELHLKIPPVKSFGGNLVISNLYLIAYQYVF
ncbi:MULTISPECIES: hypothetical protein [unclassified Helicobacter]|uniref:hypothetical protein n=1 Tax=unclassified Helicobacter TaxID=2593540 RepID=UPI000CF0E5EB|nr:MULTISPECIES: hypothetical protein [unclassified Helicobacter]